MKKSRHLAVMALGLSLGLVGLGPTALAKRPHHEKPKPEAAGQCSTSQSNDSDNSTGGSSQSGLINVNNIAVQGNNIDLLSNLLCQGVFLNDIVAGVLGTARGGDGDSDSGKPADCTTDQDTGSENDTGDSGQQGLVNANNVAVQGNNLDVLGNLLCGGNFLNDVVAGVLGTAKGGDSDRAGSGGASDCTTDQDNESESSTGDSYQDGAVNANNVAVQGNNIDALGNALCDGNFLNGLTAAVLGTARQGDGHHDGHHDGDHDGHHSRPAECATDQDADSDNKTGDSVMGGLLNLNNLAVQGNNVAVLSNGLCGSIFLNDVLVSVLGVI